MEWQTPRMCNQPDTVHSPHKRNGARRGWEESALGEPQGQCHSRISSSMCTCGLHVFGHTFLVVHLYSPELRFHDVQCMVVFTNKSFVYTNRGDRTKHMNMLMFQY
ncbi:hypothetical protein I79_003451 [Cricetulus griseus]|uniref:Uncharacterized protein n=1 Tax=Cricetulus griseus TaxID=10029 RepID=G3H004_CRIGR|nr:hypothetical protein I79_003451 [Cricetulus griseus]